MNDYIYELEIAKRYINKGIPFNSFKYYSVSRADLVNYANSGKGGHWDGRQYLFNKKDIMYFRINVILNLVIDWILSFILTVFTICFIIAMIIIFG